MSGNQTSSPNSTKSSSSESGGTIEVDPQALKSFASYVLNLVDSTVPGTSVSLTDAETKLNDIASNPPSFATPGMIPQADTLKSTIQSMAGKASANISSFHDGMRTLCNDLSTFAGQYANADALAKADAQSMWNAVGPYLETYFPNIMGAAPAAAPSLGG